MLRRERSSETTIPATARGNAAPDRAETQDEIVELLSDVVRGFRRQHVELAIGEQFPFPIYGLSLAAVREISERPGITVNELARLTGLPKSRVSVLMTRLTAQRIVRKDGDEHDSRLVRLRITPQGRQCVADDLTSAVPRHRRSHASAAVHSLSQCRRKGAAEKGRT